MLDLSNPCSEGTMTFQSSCFTLKCLNETNIAETRDLTLCLRKGNFAPFHTVLISSPIHSIIAPQRIRASVLSFSILQRQELSE